MDLEHQKILQQAFNSHQLGDLTTAIQLYNEILSKYPDDDQTLLFGAVAHCQRGDYTTASAYFSRIEPASVNTDPNYYINYGLTLSELGDIQQAISLLQRGCELDPEAFEARFNLGRCYYRQHCYQEAENIFNEALKLNPEDAETLTYLGAILATNGESQNAMNFLKRAFERGGETGFLRYITGSVFEKEGQTEEALNQYTRAFILDKNNIAACLSSSRMLAKQGKYQEAIARITDNIITNDPELYSVIECSISTIYHLQGNNKQAEEHARRALTANPESSEACGLLALSLSNTGRQIEALELFKTATSTAHPRPMDLINMSKNFTALGLTHEAIATAQKAYALDVRNAGAFSSLLLYLHYPSDISRKDITELHLNFGEVFNSRAKRKQNNDESYSSPPRIGFISGDFCVHSIQFFFEPLIQKFAEDKDVEVYLYSNTPHKDQVTARYIKYADKFIDIRNLSDMEAYYQIKGDKLNALIDLSGHTNNNRLTLLALKPVRTQLTYLGYPDTTGLSEIDYRLTDSVADADGSDNMYAEKLYRLPGCFLTYQPPEHPKTQVSKNSADNIIFGSFNNIAKISDQTLSCWAEILKNTPKSKLLLKCHGLNDNDLRLLMVPRFESKGIQQQRLIFAPREKSFEKHLSLYNSIDICLDTFPYNGTTTTFEALLMSRPVITRSGEAHVSRVGKSILTNLGVTELISGTDADYIRKATELAEDHEKTIEYHRTLSRKLLSSTLCDTELFYKKFIEALKKMQII